MYPSTAPGETFKRSLALGDRLGLKALYGPDEDEVYDGDDSVNGEYEEAGGPNLFWE
jgi:hypothetical protein